MPSRQISVVDEDETLREAVCRAIRLEQHRASSFADGTAAWDAFARVSPDCAVLSMSVGGRDGVELCRRLREKSPAIPIVAVVRPDDMDRVLDAAPGADDYLA